MRLTSMICVCLVVVSTLLSQSTDVLEVESRGVSIVYQGDTVAAFEAAVIDAKRNALETALGVHITSESIVQNYQLFSDKILAKTEGYILDWKEVRRTIDVDLMEVTISARVKSGTLVKDFNEIKSLLKAKNPYVLVVIREKFGKNKFTGMWQNNTLSQSESTVRELFLKHEVVVKDPANAVTMKNAVKSLYDGKYENIITIAKKVGANLIVFGDSVAENAGKIPVEGSVMFSYQSDITLRAIETDTGTIIASASAHAAKPHVADIAGMKVVTVMTAEKAGLKIINDCVQWWKDSLSGQGYRIELRITTDSYEKADALLQALKYMVRGVQSVSLRSYDAGVAHTEVIFMGPASLLLSEIRAKKVPIPIRVLSVGETILSIEFAK